MTLLKTAIEAF